MRRGHSPAILVPIFISLVALVSPSVGKGEELFNGYWWNEQLESVKLAYVSGFTKGTDDAIAFLRKFEDEGYRTLYQVEGCSQTSIVTLVDWIKRELSFDLFDVVEVADGVDEFYRDFRNRRIAVGYAIAIVRMQLKEKSPGVIESEIRKFRKTAREGE